MKRLPWLLYGDMEPGGGAHRYFSDVLRALEPELWPTLIVLPPSSVSAEIEKTARDMNASVLPLRVNRRLDLPAFQALRQEVRRHKIRHASLQLSSLFWGNKTVFSTLRWAGVKHIAITAHAIDPPEETAVKSRLRRMETCLFGRFVTDWIALAHYDKQIFQRLGASPESQTLLRPCVSDFPVEAAPDWEELTRNGSARGIERWIGFVGVLRCAKGIYELLEAFAAISNEFPDCGLFIVGEGEERTSLVQKCFAFGLMPRIIFTGYRSDGRALLKLCDACVLASHTEHYPFVLLEAMAEGVPVIATSVGAVPEMLGDGARGTLVPPRDIPALSEAMRKVLGSKDETHESVEKARQFVRETSSPAQFREGLKTFYHRWLEGEETIRADRD